MLSAPLASSKLAAVPSSAPAALARGSQVEAFRILKVLAEGRHGFVYLVRHAAHGTTCALKEFMPRLHATRLSDGRVSPRHAGDAIAMSVARIEFMQEAAALAGIDQPGLVRVLGLLEANRTLYRVMPLYEGLTLEQLCRQRSAAPSLGWLAGIVDDLLRALEPLHAQGRSHGYLQPNQVLVSASQRATLLGFGSVARELDDPPADPWCAPEGPGARRHRRPEPASDLYALAATAWFAATGVAPPTAAERRAKPLPGASEVLEGLGDRPGDLPQLRRGLIDALDAGMATAIGARPQTIAEFRSLLQAEPSIRGRPAAPAPRWIGDVAEMPLQHGGIEPILRADVPAPRPDVAAALTPPAPTESFEPPAAAALAGASSVAHPQVESAFMQVVPGASAPIEVVRKRGRGRTRWRAVALAAAVSMLAAGSIPWGTSPGELAPSPAASRQLPGAVLAVVPQVAANLPTLGEAPVKPAMSLRDVAVAAPARAPSPRAAVPRPAAPRATLARAVPSGQRGSAGSKPALPRSPASACSKAAQFSSCMQQHCAETAYRLHPQCFQFRRRV